MEILQQIVELDERLEMGDIDADEHQVSRDALTVRALAGMVTEAPPSEDRDEPAEKDDSYPG